MRTPSINAIRQAVEDGKLEAWVNWDGFIVIRNLHTNEQVEIECSRNYDGEKDGDSK